MTVAELHAFVVDRFDRSDETQSDTNARVRAMELSNAKRSGAFAVLTKLGLILLGVGGTVAGALIISAL